MARIRNIHPNTPIDPEFASIPVEARLLFIYSWTAADDAGNLEGNPLGLKMALFPADDWATVKRITELLDVLLEGRFYVSYAADGKQYLHIRSFAKYQKPERRTAPRCPLYPGQEYTYRVRRGNEWIDESATGTFGEQTPNEQCATSVHSLGSGVDKRLWAKTSMRHSIKVQRQSQRQTRAIHPRGAAPPPKPILTPMLVP